MSYVVKRGRRNAIDDKTVLDSIKRHTEVAEDTKEVIYHEKDILEELNISHSTFWKYRDQLKKKGLL